MTEVEFRKYYDSNNLDQIEGIWTYSEKSSWVNVVSGLRGINGENASIYRIAIIKDKNSIDSYNGYILESKYSEWTPGRLKAKYRKTAFETTYEELIYMRNYSQKTEIITIEGSGVIKSVDRSAEYPINYELESVFLKIYPSITKNPNSTSSSEARVSGSGFLISTGGLVITNFHVIEGSDKIDILFPDKNITKTASLVLKDKNNDIAVLKVEEFNYNDIFNANIPYSFVDINSVNVGQEVYTLGFPLGSIMGSNARLSTGRINSLYGIQDDPRLFQIGNPLQPGNSGGPLFNNNGKLVGIVVSSLNAKYFYENLGIIPQNVNFAIKVSYLKNLIGMTADSEEIVNRESSMKNLSMEEQVEKLNPFIVQILGY